MNNELPKPTIQRLCQIYNLLAELDQENIPLVSSGEMGQMLGLSAQSLRKDLSLLGDMDNTGARYDIKKLKKHLSEKFGFTVNRKACVVGVGRLGAAILDYAQLGLQGYTLVAGFDSNMNKIETMKTPVTLYPAYQIQEIVRRDNIELAVLCVPAQAAQPTADKLIEGGIRGIVNFTPSHISTGNDKIFISQIDVIKEFRVLSALISLSSRADEDRSYQ